MQSIDGFSNCDLFFHSFKVVLPLGTINIDDRREDVREKFEIAVRVFKRILDLSSPFQQKHSVFVVQLPR